MKQVKYVKLLCPLATVLWGLFMAYVVYFVARVAFLLENLSLYPDLPTDHLLELLCGGLTFDTSAILYTNALWVLMVLFPLHLKETPLWHKICCWTFVIINTLCLALNLGDSVYFRYTMRRTTTTVFQEFENENNLGGIFLTESLNHWYFFLLAGLVAWGLWKGYRAVGSYGSYGTYRSYRPSKPYWPYYLAMVFSLAAFIPFCVAGMRGGWTRDIRPITISNANNYCDRPTEAGIVLNTPFSLIRTIGKNNFEVVTYYSDKEELEAIFNPIHLPGDSLTERRKNVVVIIIESFGREYIGAYNRHVPGYKGYTPFTD